MARIELTPDESGMFPTFAVHTGARHTFVLRKLVLEHRYHDEQPARGCTYRLTFPNGFQCTGHLDETGRATIYGVPSGPISVQFGPDARSFERIHRTPNPDYKETMTDRDFDELAAKHCVTAAKQRDP